MTKNGGFPENGVFQPILTIIRANIRLSKCSDLLDGSVLYRISRSINWCQLWRRHLRKSRGFYWKPLESCTQGKESDCKILYDFIRSYRNMLYDLERSYKIVWKSYKILYDFIRKILKPDYLTQSYCKILVRSYYKIL